MSSQDAAPKDSLLNLNRKFENQFSNINTLLDKVIEKNSRVVDISQIQEGDKANNFQIVNPSTYISNTQSTNKTTEVQPQSYTYYTPRPEVKSSNGQYYQSPVITVQEPKDTPYKAGSTYTSYQGDGFLKTPYKPTNAHSARSTAQSQNESYDYSGGHFISPFNDSAKQTRFDNYNKSNKPVRENSQEIVFESTLVEPSTFHMSNNNLDSPANPNDLFFNAENRTPSVQNIDYSTNLNASNNDIFGEKALKCRLPRKQKVEPNPENLVQENLEQYVQDLTNANRYAPQDVLRSIEPSEDGKYFLVDPVKNHPTFRKSSLDFSQDPIDQIVVLTTPERDIKPEDKLVGIYQQVSEEYTDGTSYTGEKTLGLRQGKGTYYYHDGYRYEGTWHEDKMSGFGILWVAEDIKWYEGEWKDNTFHGRGIIYNITPEELDPEANFSNDLSQVGNGWLKYEGNFHNGSKHGFGTLFLTNGDSFTGNFNFDNVEGRGSYAKPEMKRIIAGSWVKNVLKSSY